MASPPLPKFPMAQLLPFPPPLLMASLPELMTEVWSAKWAEMRSLLPSERMSVRLARAEVLARLLAAGSLRA